MRPSRLMVLLGAAGAAAALFGDALATDGDLVERLAATSVPTIWTTFSRDSQWVLLGSLALSVLVAVLTRRSRVGAFVILAATATGAFLVWQGRADALSASEALAADLDGAVREGIIGWSPGVAAGPGFLAALTGWGIAGLGGLWGVVSRGSSADVGKAEMEADPDPGDVEVDGNATAVPDEPRYLDVIIESGGGPSVGE